MVLSATKQQQQHHHLHQKSKSKCWFADYSVLVFLLSLLVLFCVDEYQQIGEKQQQQQQKARKTHSHTTVLTFTSFEIIG